MEQPVRSDRAPRPTGPRACGPPGRRLSQSLLLLAALLGGLTVGYAPPAAGALERPTDLTAADVREIEVRCVDASAKAVAATVGLQIGRNLGSGVLVSPDGLVITAGHVVEAPDREVQVTLADGRVVWGHTLGVNRWIDSGMLKLDDPGPWPYLEMRESADLEPGDWVLALGHPGGVEKGRPPVVRFGRVSSSEARVIRTDCTIVSGDSGGPLVDLDGRVVGVHTSLRPNLVANDHLPIDTFHRTWDRLLAGEAWGGLPGGRAILGFEGESEGSGCRVVDVVDGFAADLAGLQVDDVITSIDGVPLSGGFPELEQRISERTVGEEVRIEVDRGKAELELHARLSRYEGGEPVRIVRAPWRDSRHSKNDRQLMSAFRSSVRDVGPTIASIVCDGQRVALGTVVGADGRIVTKASEISGSITCWIEGRHYDAEIVGTDDDFDLALLQIDATGLTPAVFAERDVDVGQWVVTPGTGELPLAVGVLSAPPRAVPGRAGFLGVVMDDVRGGVEILEVKEDTSADRAGLRPGDVLTRLNGRRLSNWKAAARMLRSIRPNSEIELAYRRGSDERKIDIRLGTHPFEEENPVELQNRQSGPISEVRSGFPLAFQHDSVLEPDECGGPVLDREGHVIGVNLARAGRTSSLAIPGPRLLRVLASIQRAAGR